MADAGASTVADFGRGEANGDAEVEEAVSDAAAEDGTGAGTTKPSFGSDLAIEEEDEGEDEEAEASAFPDNERGGVAEAGSEGERGPRPGVERKSDEPVRAVETEPVPAEAEEADSSSRR